jgi:hypothetical protein
MKSHLDCQPQRNLTATIFAADERPVIFERAFEEMIEIRLVSGIDVGD